MIAEIDLESLNDEELITIVYLLENKKIKRGQKIEVPIIEPIVEEILEKKFPEIEGYDKFLEGILIDKLKVMIKNKYNLNYLPHAYLLNIHSIEEWNLFIESLIKNSNAIREYLEVENNFQAFNSKVAKYLTYE